MSLPDIEAILQGVPCVACKRPRADHPVRDLQTNGQFCNLFGEDFPAMAVAVREAVEREQRTHLEAEYFKGDTNASYEEWLMGSVDALRAEIATLDALARNQATTHALLVAERDEYKERMEWWRRRWEVEQVNRNRLAREVKRLRGALVRSHPNVHGHEGWELCDACAALTPPDVLGRG